VRKHDFVEGAAAIFSPDCTGTLGAFRAPILSVLDPKVLLLLATGALLLLNGLIARAAAAKAPKEDGSSEDAPGEQGVIGGS
jgi:hypothetical protein